MNNSFEVIESKSEDTKSDIKWYGSEQQTDLKTLSDSGKGEPVLIRFKKFQFKPDLRKLPTKEQLITPEFVKHIDAELWGDGLRRVMEPRVDIQKEFAMIAIPAVAATGQSFLETPKMLQEI